MENNPILTVCYLRRLITVATFAFLFGLFFLFFLLNSAALAAPPLSESDDSATKTFPELAEEGITAPARH